MSTVDTGVAFGLEEGQVSLRWLAGQPDLGIEILHDSGRDFSVLHPCELRDPREFVGSGAVILLTGMAFEGHPDQLSEYVRGVASGGVSGVGFGVGIAFDEVPPAMVDAARECDVSLFTVALRVPFVSVLACVHAELQRQREEGLERFIAQQGALNDAAVAGLDELVEKTTELLGAHVCLVDKDGRVFAQASAPTLPPVDWNPVITDARSQNFHAARHVGQWNVLAQRLADHGSRSFGLLAASRESFGVNERALLKQAAGLAELNVKRPQELRQTQNQLNSMAMAIQLGMDQPEDPMRRIFHMVGDAQERVRPVLVKSEGERAHQRFTQALDARLQDHGRLLFELTVDESSSLFLFRGNRSMKNLQDLLRDIRGNKRIVVGQPMPWSELGVGIVRELESIAFGLQPGMLAGPESRTLSWAKDPRVKGAVDTRARETWGKVRAYDAEHSTDLADTLEVYLRAGGHVSRTAEELHAHRHTVRKRIADLEDLLEVDLKDPLVAAELLILGISVTNQY